MKNKWIKNDLNENYYIHTLEIYECKNEKYSKC